MTDERERNGLWDPEAPGVRGREMLTYSALQRFRNCPKKHELRFEEGLGVEEAAEPLWFGGIWSAMQEAFWNERKRLIEAEIAVDEASASAVFAAYKILNQACPRDRSFPERKSNLVLSEMMRAYAMRWTASEPGDADLRGVHDSEFEVLGVEVRFVTPIVSPTSKPDRPSYSKTFCLAGAADRLLRRKSDGSIWIGEMKTASQIGDDYLALLWMNLQIVLYGRALSKLLGVRVRGALYDICAKPGIKLRPEKTETDEEFAARIEKQRAKARTFKTEKTIEKKLVEAAAEEQAGPKTTPGESDEEYTGRLREWLGRPNSFHRELIEFTDDDLQAVDGDVWAWTQQILAARSSGRFSRNTDNCRAYNRTCEFEPVCRNGGMLNDVTRDLYTQVSRHPELEDEDTRRDAAASAPLPF